jgi:hypothetical protein
MKVGAFDDLQHRVEVNREHAPRPMKLASVRHDQETLSQEMVAGRFHDHGAARTCIDRQLRNI